MCGGVLAIDIKGETGESNSRKLFLADAEVTIDCSLCFLEAC
jgi:phosphoribosylaminoimidazole-succinocarboxamide synthase